MSVGRKSSSVGFWLLVVGLVLMGGVSFLMSRYSPFVYVHRSDPKFHCVGNLRQINGAKEQWAMEKGADMGDQPTDKDLFGPGLYLKEKPICPIGGIYCVNGVGQDVTCSVEDHVAAW
jgi:hypothetical protein